MSGHGSDPVDHGSYGGSESDCMKLFFQTMLTSPKEDVLKTLDLNDILDLELSAGTTVLAKTTKGRIAGSIISGKHAQLVACMRQGISFVARVLKLEGGACDVEVRPKPR